MDKRICKTSSMVNNKSWKHRKKLWFIINNNMFINKISLIPINEKNCNALRINKKSTTRINKIRKKI